MAPTKGTKGTKGAKSGSAKSQTKRSSKSSSSSSTSKPKSRSSSAAVRRPATQQKTKPAHAKPQKIKKKRVYTEKELGIPKLNTITPAGVTKAKGKKKGKVFVDDQESMMTILAIVNADKEGQIESKMIKARQMEEIRQARQREMDARQEAKKSKLEDTKNSLRRQKKSKSQDTPTSDAENQFPTPKSSKSGKKRVSFA